MNKRSLLVVAATASAAGMVMLAIAGQASAVPGGTTATVTVQTGFLTLSVPVDAGNLGTVVDTVPGSSISGTLGQVQVSDARSSIAGSGWVATVSSSAFTPSTGATIAASAVGYTAGAITKVGTASYLGSNPADLTAAVAAVTATGITGNNSATWTPTIHVFVAGGTLAGVYSGTITHSVA
jgi:hypothetical protein